MFPLPGRYGFIFWSATSPFLIAHILDFDLDRPGEVFSDSRLVSLSSVLHAVFIVFSLFRHRPKASMCAIRKGDVILCALPSLFCPLWIYFLEKTSRFGHCVSRATSVLIGPLRWSSFLPPRPASCEADHQKVGSPWRPLAC